jgi:BTB/POZ domain
MSSSEDGDVVVVVGGKEFVEDSRMLCYLSEYFQAAFRSGMKESLTSRFEFPDEDPAGWELFMKFAKPFAGTTDTAENLDTILHWCDKLLVKADKGELDQPCNFFPN